MTWFSKLFGFEEGAYRDTQAQFVVEEDYLISKANGARLLVGSFETPTLRELSSRLEELNFADGLGGATFENICGDVRSLISDPSNEGCVFQAASQFNCLEMINPGVSPDQGITCYEYDRTQGPACALACPAATVFRNYMVGGKGQGDGAAQLDMLRDVGDLVGNKADGYWRMSNGYALPTSPSKIRALGEKLASDSPLRHACSQALRVGIHWNTGVAKSTHAVCQVFTSALPVAYSTTTPCDDWETFARLVLESAFASTLAAAALLAGQRSRRMRVYLTSIGGGAFGNRTKWIVESIQSALFKYRGYPLDVKLVHFGRIEAAEYEYLYV